MGALNIFVFLITIVSVIICKPIEIGNVLRTEDISAFTTEENSEVINSTQTILDFTTEENSVVDNETETILSEISSRMFRNQIRPGMLVTSYTVEITPDVDAGTFSGRVVAQVSITDPETREDEIKFYVADLDVASVVFSLAGGTATFEADHSIDEDDGILEIDTGMTATLYNFIIEYTGSLETAGKGLYAGHYGTNTYLAMNLHPTHARRVFPCMDEPTEASIISFTFNNLEYTHVASNSMLEENSVNQFRALQGPPHLWGMVAHNFITVNIPTANVQLYGRGGLSNQDALASVAISSYFTNLNEWTNKPYFEILLNQDGRLHVLALPDVSRDWHALSTVGIWEPHVFIETNGSVKQRKTVLVKIAEALAKQWFGFVIFPENWRYEWVVYGLASYAGWEMLKLFQPDFNVDVTQLDVNTLFVTEVIQESLLRDAYFNSQPLEPSADLFNEDAIRDHVFGLLKYKAPAILRMMRLVLGETDFIQSAGRALLNARALQTVNTLSFIDALNSDWMTNGNDNVDEMDEYLEPWINHVGYPLLTVTTRQGGVHVNMETFGFSRRPYRIYEVPITYTTSVNLDFSNVLPVQMMDGTISMDMSLDFEEDFVLFNIQGQGYYRVNYDNILWERIIEALDDPEVRETIHPLNRATLVDDSLNIARATLLDYEVAFQVVLTMEHETEYAVWKAFVRNMDFLRKRLVALVTEDEDLDPDIYLRMVRRTIGSIENELGFSPEINLSEPAMTALTRGLVMDHACRANYQPCIAAAVDWFYASNNEQTVNPDIPHELRPAVYCTMVREGDEAVIEALEARLEIEANHYERVVILESLGCSQDADFIQTLLRQTIAPDSPYAVEERVRIFTAIVESSFQNAGLALDFITFNCNEIRDMYGGAEKLEEVIFMLADNMADEGLSTGFQTWVQAQNNNLEDSQDAASRALLLVQENRRWDAARLELVYEWIDENHAPTLVLSLSLLCVSLFFALFNH